MENPVVTAREADALKRTEAAIRMGVNYFSLARLEQGLVASLSESWRPRFGLMGWDFDVMREQYKVWHESRKAKGPING